MFDKYNEIFERYLRVCKGKYDSNKPYDNLEECCITCEKYTWELSGMLELLEATGEITSEKKDVEFQRILDNFSSHKLFSAYMTKGEVMVFSK